MKNLIAKLKSLNYKQVAIRHAEKAALGIVLLLILAALAGTSWSRYERKPEEFTDKVRKGEANLAASQWPEDQRKQFQSSPDVREAVKESNMGADLSRFEYRTPLFWPLYPKKEKYKEPTFLAIQELVADVGYVILEFSTELAAETAATDADAATAEGVTGATPAAGAPATGGPTAAETAPRNVGPSSAEIAPRNAPGKTAGGPDTAAGGAMRLDAAKSPMGLGTTVPIGPTGVEARGLRYIAVRGIFPFKEQIDKIAVAMNEPIAAEAEHDLDFVDFILERQTAVAGPDPWTGPWEQVNIQDAYDVLNKVTDFDVDLVDPSLTDAVFTMPLPYRMTGEWGEKVTHPKIKTMTTAQAEQQMLFNEKLMEVQKKMEKQDEPFQKKGFAPQQADVRDMRRQVNLQEVIDAVKKELESDDRYKPFLDELARGGDPRGQLRGLTRDEVRISGQVLLFRYLDFDVEPGNAYRYRVRLVLTNPNFQRPIAELMDPASAEGLTREAPVSAASPMAFLDKDVHVFLTRVEQIRGRSDISADIEVFQYYEKSGTMIRADLKKMHPGDRVGGKTKTEVLRPAENKFGEESDVEITTRNVLLDIGPSTPFDPAAHPDLQLDPRARTGMGLVDEVLMLSQSGQFVVLDTMSAREDRKLAKANLDAQNQQYESLKKKAAVARAAGGRGRGGRGAPGSPGGHDEYGAAMDALATEMQEYSEEMPAGDMMHMEGSADGYGEGVSLSYPQRRGRSNPLRIGKGAQFGR